jgi:hypothetical protein
MLSICATQIVHAELVQTRFQKVQSFLFSMNGEDWMDLSPVYGSHLDDFQLRNRLKKVGFDAREVSVFCVEPLTLLYARVDGIYYFLNGSSRKKSFAVVGDDGEQLARHAVHDLQSPENYIASDNSIVPALLRAAMANCPQ